MLPYKQYFIEFSNWSKNDKFYYRIGYDYYYESLVDKTIEARTIPMQYVYKLKKGNSFTVYFELQNKYDATNYKEYDFVYLSPSYNHFGNWSFTFFADLDLDNEDTYAIDYTVNIKDTQLSLFVGSQKGGMVLSLIHI